MNVTVGIISAVGAIGAVLAHLLIAAWYYGRLTQKVEGINDSAPHGRSAAARP